MRPQMKGYPQFGWRRFLTTFGKQRVLGWMKVGRLMCLVALLCGVRAFAQQQATGEARAGGFDYALPSLPLMLDFTPAPTDTLSLGKHLQLQSPLAAPVKSKKIWDFPRRLLRSINPFSKSPPSGQVVDVGPVDARAWSTVVGWNPRSSGFLDDTHHEPQLRLLTIRGGK